jgi:hypothetical protein
MARPDVRTVKQYPDLESPHAPLPADWLSSLLVSNTAFADTWNDVTTVGPSKNAVYDKIVDIVLIGDVHLDGGTAGTFSYSGTPASITFRFDGGIASTTY